MAPRKSEATGEDHRCPKLKLIMEKGPLAGQTFDFGPGSLIRIGRIVRGNTVPIKDAGISSKHLVVQVETEPEPGCRCRWTITDLGSSNGTVLNGAALERPSAAISDGDIIKIGEQTWIRVRFEVESEVSSSTIVRRNARRGVRDQGVGLGVIDEFCELGLGNKEDKEIAEVEVKQQGRNVRTRSSKKNETVRSTDLNLDENKDLGVSGAKELQGLSMRGRIRSSRKEDEAIAETGIDSRVIEGKRTRKGARGRKDLLLSEETEKEEGIKSRKEDGAAPARLGSTRGVKESNVVKTAKGKMVADLETMTLGEWIDFLEVYLPQQIFDETEAVIAAMRQTAERFHQFMLQQKKDKGKSKAVKC